MGVQSLKKQQIDRKTESFTQRQQPFKKLNVLSIVLFPFLRKLHSIKNKINEKSILI